MRLKKSRCSTVLVSWRGIYSIESTGHAVQGHHEECAKEVGSAKGIRYAVQIDTDTDHIDVPTLSLFFLRFSCYFLFLVFCVCVCVFFGLILGSKFNVPKLAQVGRKRHWPKSTSVDLDGAVLKELLSHIQKMSIVCPPIFFCEHSANHCLCFGVSPESAADSALLASLTTSSKALKAQLRHLRRIARRNLWRFQLKERCMHTFLHNESRRNHTKEKQHRDHEDHVCQARAFNLLSLENLVHKAFSHPPGNASTWDAEAAVDIERERLRNLPAWRETKVKSKRMIFRARSRRRFGFCRMRCPELGLDNKLAYMASHGQSA